MENGHPPVSVCIPTYNSEATVSDTLRSALAQRYANLEIIVSDDASVDRTVSLVRSFNDARLKLIVQPKNLGLVGNWNAAVAAARGELIKLLPADDLLDPDCIRMQVNALVGKPDCVFDVCDTIIIDEKGRTNARIRWPLGDGCAANGPTAARSSVRTHNRFGSPVNVLFRKSVFETVGGFDGRFPFCADYDLWLSMCGHGQISLTRRFLARFRIRDGSNTNQVIFQRPIPWIKEHYTMVKKHQRLGRFTVSSTDIVLHVVGRVVRSIGVAAFILIAGQLSRFRNRG